MLRYREDHGGDCRADGDDFRRLASGAVRSRRWMQVSTKDPMGPTRGGFSFMSARSRRMRISSGEDDGRCCG